jgi:hypothetical protein
VASFGTVSHVSIDVAAGNQVLAAGSGGRIALVRALLLIFFVSFSICCCPFPIRWRWQRFKIDVALIPQQHHALGDLSAQLLGRGIGVDAVDRVATLVVDVLDRAQPRMPVRRRQCRQLCRLAIAFAHLVQWRIGLVAALVLRSTQATKLRSGGRSPQQPARLRSHRVCAKCPTENISRQANAPYDAGRVRRHDPAAGS